MQSPCPPPPLNMNHHGLHPKPRLLTLNCHEAWIYQLGSLGYPLDIVDGLPNRHVPSWNLGTRPIPGNSRLITLADTHAPNTKYDCIIAHSMGDLMDIRHLPGARILVIHNRLESRIQSSPNAPDPHQVKQTLKRYLSLIGGSVVAVSASKGESWGFSGGTVVVFGADIQHYPPWHGDTAAGLRIANQITLKKEILHWNFHQNAFKDIPVTLVGDNPDMPGVHPSKNWEDLKTILSHHRFFIHTAHPQLEDGYNMATIEAMAAGLPILGNVHPTSPVEHGVSGFLSDDPTTLNQYAHMLLNDRDLAMRMGNNARQYVAAHFSLSQFAAHFQQAIENAMATSKTARRDKGVSR
ncbi:MAG: glycosyltransferase [Magnetococcales bacterium]|nr:glycosyltransferase [Magnetococcales bacterium]